MTIFSEIYGTYFRIASELLSREYISKKEANEIIGKMGFRDSVLFLPQKLFPQNDGSDWGLLKNDEKTGFLRRITRNKPVKILTTLQKSWIRAILNDPKIRLFTDDETLSALDSEFSGIKPLFRREQFKYTDVFSDGDPYFSEKYRLKFRIILNAVKKHEILNVFFISGKGRKISGDFLPLRIEYSRKNDKFRVHCLKMKNGKPYQNAILNISRLMRVTPTGSIYDKEISVEDYFNAGKCTEPVTVFVSEERNGLERFLMEFASYEKQTEQCEGGCMVKLWYEISDESELLIQLLGFGPVIEVKSPERFRDMISERVKRQYDLIFEENNA